MADFVKMPDGSLVLVGKAAPKQSAWERFKSTVRSIPDRFSPKPPPWWIAQPQQPVVTAAPVIPVQQMTAQQLLAPVPGAAPVNDFAEAEKLANKRAAIVKEFGTVPKAILANEFFVGRER